MTVYVDDAIWPFRDMLMCHMVADTLEELHAMANEIGMKRAAFQDAPKASHPHYDVSQERRALALELGAVYVPAKVLSHAIVARRRLGNNGPLDVDAARRWFAANGISEHFGAARRRNAGCSAG